MIKTASQAWPRAASNTIAMCIAAAICVLFGAGASAQEAPLTFDPVPIAIDSGEVANAGSHVEPVFSTIVSVQDAAWLRLRFGDVVLSGDSGAGTGAYLRITSLADGAIQTLNAVHVRQWRNTSAYFNGDSVAIDIIAHPGAGPCRVIIAEAFAGSVSASPRAVCDTDDRVPSTDPRVGRGVPVGCTAWLIDDCNTCLLTAGHCVDASGSTLDVVEFNVPLSNSNGSIVHPPPEHQYVADVVSLQWQSGSVGGDWGYFGVHPNPVTGLLPAEAQNVAGVTRSFGPSPAPGQPLRITGYGTTSSPIPPNWNKAQKTHVGPTIGESGTALQYGVDTTGGNSGSPVYSEETGVAHAIHTHGFCNLTENQNSGTLLDQPALTAAFNAPLGVCRPRLSFAFPGGRPSIVHSLLGATLEFQVQSHGCTEPAAATGQAFYDAGDGQVALDIEQPQPHHYLAHFPPLPCLAIVSYHVQAMSASQQAFSWPDGAPANSFAVVAAAAATPLFSYDFQLSLGWSVQNVSTIAGGWQRGVPNGGGLHGDPLFDYDGSGACWLTGNAAGESDVDGGPTRLLSPAWNLANTSAPVLSYARWFSHVNASPPPPPELDIDSLDVELSNNNGASWVLVESVSASSAGWVLRTIRIADYLTPTSQMRLRFSVRDNPDNSTTEAAIDAVTLTDYACTPACNRGDLNLDGTLDGRDVSLFSEALLTPPPAGTLEFCAADVDSDDTLTLDDAVAFVACLLNEGCP